MSNINEKMAEAEAAERPMAARIEQAVSERVAPLAVATKQHGDAVLVKVYGSERTFGYRPTMPDGTPNLHTPETFADEVARIAAADVQKHIDMLEAARAKRARRAEKRIKELSSHPRV